jgi:hypothetical protein
MEAGMKHSMKEAVKIQRAFEERFRHKGGLMGVGICLNPRTGDLALNVQLSKKKNVTELPKTFNGLDVLVDIVGAVRAL